MLFAGPDVRRGQSLPLARITDVMPTVLGWLGAGLKDTKDGGPMLDGVDLFDNAMARTRP